MKRMTPDELAMWTVTTALAAAKQLRCDFVSVLAEQRPVAQCYGLETVGGGTFGVAVYCIPIDVMDRVNQLLTEIFGEPEEQSEISSEL